MQATLCLRAAQPSANIHCPRTTLQRHCGHRQNANFLALRRPSTFSYGGLRAMVRAQASASRPSDSGRSKKTLASVAGAVVATVALASAMGCICPSWSRKGRIGLAGSWYNIPIHSSADRSHPDPKRDIPSKEQQKHSEMQQKIAAEVLREMFERKDLPSKFYKITPNYPKLKEYFEDHLRLSDQAWETLISKWKEVKPGQDQIEIGLLLVDIYIIKGDVAGANDIYKEVIKTAPDSDQRPLIRMTIVNMIKDWEKKKEGEKKIEWERFAKKMQEIASSPFIDEPDEEP